MCIQYTGKRTNTRSKASWPTVRFVQTVLRRSAGVNLARETNSKARPLFQTHTQYTQYAQCMYRARECASRMRTVELFSNMNIHESSAARASRR